MKSLFLIIAIFIAAILFSPFTEAARPNPEKAAQEIFNDIYVDSPVGGESIRTTTSIDTTGLATDTNQVTANAYLSSIQALLGPQMASGTLVNFVSTNVLDSAYSDIFTAPSSVTFAQVTQNGGGDFYLRVNSTDYGYVYPGEAAYLPMNLATGDVVRIKSVSGTVSTGKLYINYFK